jgi:hypothetical protein
MQTVHSDRLHRMQKLQRLALIASKADIPTDIACGAP